MALRKAVLILGISAAVAGCKSSGDSGANPPRTIDPMPTPTPTNSSQQTSGISLAADDPVIVTINGIEVRMSELQQPLLKAYGLDVLTFVMLRDTARAECQRQGIAVTPEDIASERKATLDEMVRSSNAPEHSDPEKVLEQLLAQPNARDAVRSVAEFDLLMEANAYMKKIVEKNLATKITDEDVRQRFDQEYGSALKVRHIEVANITEAMEAKNRVLNGEDFAAVARAMSRNETTGPRGGELAPFTVKNTRVPENFRQVAAALKPGEVSDPVQTGGSYHIIQLMEVREPKAVKFDDVKDSIRARIEERVLAEGVKLLRERFAEQARAQMKVLEPTLKKEFDARIAARDQVIRDQEKMRKQMEADNAARRSKGGPASAPAAAPPPPVPPPMTMPSETPPPPVASPPVAPPPPTAVPPPATAPSAAPAAPLVPANPLAPPAPKAAAEPPATLPAQPAPATMP